MNETKAQIADIRRALKKAAPTLSVRNGRGTAWGWVDISGSGEAGTFTPAERAALVALGMSPGGNFANISPDTRGYWHQKLTGQRVPTGGPCLVCRAPGVEHFGCPCDLTHWLCAAHHDIPRRDCAFINRTGPHFALDRGPEVSS